MARVASNLVSPADHSTLPHVAPNHIESGTGKLLPYNTVAEDQVISAKHLFAPGQILYSKIRPYLAKVIVVDFAGLCSADMYPVVTDLDARYLKWWMLSPNFTRFAAGKQARTVLPKINTDALGRLPVPVAPPAEQRRIVAILEDHLSRLDAANAYVRSATKRLANVRRSALDRLFGGQDVPLADLIDNISAGKSYGAASAPAADDEWGIIKVSAMTWGKFDPAENKAVPGDRADARFEIREGDLLVSRANTNEYVGASVLVGPVRPRLLLSDKSLRVSPADGVRPDWLWRALQAPSARRQISALATGTKDSMRNISQASLMQVRVPRATPQEQAAAVGAYAEIAAAVDRFRTELDSAHRRSAGLGRSFLAAAFSGQLTDEMATA